MRALRPFFLVVDVGFLLYWIVTALGLLPKALLFRDYGEPLVTAWNWSFLPLDLAISATGLTSLTLMRRRDPRAAPLALGSLVLTSASGLMALAFWTARCDFAFAWWAPNAFLLLYPVAFFGPVTRAWFRDVSRSASRNAASDAGSAAVIQ